MDDVGKDAEHYMDALAKHAGDPLSAAEGMEYAMERDIKDAMSAEEQLLAGHGGRLTQGSIPGVDMVDVSAISQQAASSMNQQRASIMSNMQRSMAQFNEVSGSEMSDEGSARHLVEDQEHAA